MNGLVMLLLLCVSGVISGSETAVFSLPPADRRRLVARHPLLARLLSRPTSLLVSLLLANLTLNVAYFTVATNWSLELERAGRDGGAAAVYVGSLVALVVGGEILPKTLALALPVPLVRWLGPSLLVLSVLLAPLVAGGTLLTRLLVQLLGRAGPPRGEPDSADFKSALSSGVALGSYRAVELSLLHDVVDVAERRARQVMVPRVDVVFLDLADTRERWYELMAARPFTDYPVVDGQPDALVGTVNAVRFLSAAADVPRRQLLDEALLAPRGVGAERLVLRMLDEQRHLAILLDEYGGVVGVVGLSALCQTVLGEVEALPAAAWIRRHRHHLAVLGDCPLHELEAELGLELSSRGSDTLSGHLAEQLGRMPRRGDEVLEAGWRFRVVSLRGRRVGQALVMRSVGPLELADVGDSVPDRDESGALGAALDDLGEGRAP